MLLASLTVCTRAVVNANEGVAPSWLKELYCDGLKDFMTKHTHMSAAPFEQLMERFPSVACVVLLESLNTHAVSSSERAFCQAEAFRLIGLLLNKRRNLSPEAKEVLHRGLGPLLTGLAKVLEEQAADLNSKRLKPLVECCQTVTTVLKDDKWLVVQASADTPSKKGKGKNKKKGEQEEAPATATTTAAGNHREASLALGQVLLTVREKIASDNIKASLLRIAKQLGVSVSAENGGSKKEKEEVSNKKEEEGKKDKKNQKKRPHDGAEEENGTEEGQRKTGSAAKKGGQTEKAQGQKKSKKAK
jgi:hypothetical protein